MGLSAASPRRWTRRALLSSLTASGLLAEAQIPVFPSELYRYSDPATDLDVYRLTDPGHSSFLAAYYNRTLNHRGQFLVYWSDRTGSAQAFRLNLRTGESAQLTSAPSLDGATMALTPGDRSLCFFDGPSLRELNLAKVRDRVVYTVPERWRRTAGASVTADGAFAVIAETREGASRIRLIGLAQRPTLTGLETDGEITHPLGRPGRSQLLYRMAGESLWIVNYDGRGNRRLKTPPGGIGPARWGPDGRTVLYLHFPEDPRELYAIREYAPDEDRDALVGSTSQFVHFSPNGDASVFAGASRNAASPHLLLLLRATRRELTLCEHRSSHPASVAPVFSPDSQRVFFQSDMHGKPAIYRVQVERFVERTDLGG